MRIVCPNCAAAYEVPANRLQQRRTVRCARCDQEWVAVGEVGETPHPTEPVETPQQPLAALPAVTAMDRLAASPPVAGRSAALIAAWVVTLIVLVGAAAAVVTWRDAIVHAWPPSGRILGEIGSHGVTGG